MVIRIVGRRLKNLKDERIRPEKQLRGKYGWGTMLSGHILSTRNCQN